MLLPSKQLQLLVYWLEELAAAISSAPSLTSFALLCFANGSMVYIPLMFAIVWATFAMTCIVCAYNK